MKVKWLFVSIISTLLLMASVVYGDVKNSATASQKSVLVTGASSGIGRKITETLAAKGYFVYAGARKQKDLDALNSIENVESIRLDVTSQQDIDAAVVKISKAGRGLYGLVNNAGVSNYEPLMEVDVDKLDFVFNVNVLGIFRVTKAFLPLIIKEQGRVTSISSMAGIVSSPIMGVYSMSKHAVEAFSDTLSAELKRVGVKVSVIEPGRFRSQINQNAIKRMSKAPKDSLWAKERLAMLNRDRSGDKDPAEVAEAVVHALFNKTPKMRYLVVPDQGSASYTIKIAMQELVQLNYNQKFSLSRDTLVDILDQSLVEVKIE